MALKYLLSVVIIGHALAQSEPSISDAIASLPPELQGKVDEKQVQGLQNKFSEVMKDKCAKNGGPDAYLNTQKALKSFETCLKSLVDPEALRTEIENAKPNGEVDEVFKKYCAKTPEFERCFRNITESVKPCFTADERKNFNTVYNVSEKLADFICYKEGDRIALFIAENGQECLQEKGEEIQNCVNQTMGGAMLFDQNNITADSIPKLQFGETECAKFSELQKCVVSVLETCTAPTTANIVESLFKFIRKETPCRVYAEKAVTESPPNSANALLVPTITLATILAAILV